MAKSYTELNVWKKSMQLFEKIDILTKALPLTNRALADQMKRSAISIPSNIAEGYGRSTTKEYLKFLYYSKGSLFELETQLRLYDTICNYNKDELLKAKVLAIDVGKMLNKLISVLETKVRE